MSDASGYIALGKERLHYLRWGNGGRLLLAFHGYGNDAGIFYPFQKYLAEEYTILSFDMPHHGNSKWADDVPLMKQDLAVMVEKLQAEYRAGKISLLGYSMGGRVCLSIMEVLPASIDKVVLVAADGLAVNFYYYFFTHTWLGKKMFRNMLERPGRYFGVINWLKQRNLLDASRYKFVMQYLQPEERRKMLLQVWPGTSDLVPKPAKLKRLIKQYGIRVSIFMGVYDKIMPPKLAIKFKSGLDTVQVHVLEKGHRLIDKDTVEQMARTLI